MDFRMAIFGVTDDGTGQGTCACADGRSSQWSMGKAADAGAEQTAGQTAGNGTRFRVIHGAATATDKQHCAHEQFSFHVCHSSADLRYSLSRKRLIRQTDFRVKGFFSFDAARRSPNDKK